MKSTLVAFMSVVFACAACQPPDDSAPAAKTTPTPPPPPPAVVPAATNPAAAETVPKPAGGWDPKLVAVCKADATNTFCDADSWPKAKFDTLTSTLAAASGPCTDYFVNITSECLKVHDGSGTGEQFDCLSRGATVCIKSQASGWGAAAFPAVGKTGYLSMKYLSTSKPGAQVTSKDNSESKSTDAEEKNSDADSTGPATSADGSNKKCGSGNVLCKARGDDSNRRCFQPKEIVNDIQYFYGDKVLFRFASEHWYCFKSVLPRAKEAGPQFALRNPFRAGWATEGDWAGCIADFESGFDRGSCKSQ